MDPDIRNFFIDCYQNYLPSIQNKLPEFPKRYVYPNENLIKPVLPVEINRNWIMLIGAFSSARFERREGMLIPIGDNLSPFGEEKYFDGREIRVQASRKSLNETYFPQLEINADDLWLTDIVKIYLFPDKHIKNCNKIAPHIAFSNTHDMFKKIAIKSMDWMKHEIELCDPKLIITLGEIPARVIQSDYKTKNIDLLNGSISTLSFNPKYIISHLAHPEIRRRNKDWDQRTKNAINTLRDSIKELIN